MLIILIVVMCIIHCCNKTNNISIEQYDIEGFARKPMNNIKFGRIPERSAQISRMEKARVAKARADAKKATRVAKARADAEEAARVAKARADAEEAARVEKARVDAEEAAAREDAAELVRLEKEEADQIAADIEQANVDKEAEEANTTAANNLKTAATNIANNNRNIYYNRTDAEKTNQLAQFETYLETQQYDSFKYQLAKILYDLPDIGPSYAEKVQVIGNLINLYSESEDKFKEGIRNIYIVNDFLLTDLAMVRL